MPNAPFSSKYDWAWKVLEHNKDMDEYALFSLYVDQETLHDLFGTFSVAELSEVVRDFKDSHEL